MSIFGTKKKPVEPEIIPTTVEMAIPIQDTFEDGIFLVGRNSYAKTFRFTDINYAVASKEDKEGMFLGYSEILNSFDSGATTKITINNRRIRRSKFEQDNMLPMREDVLDGYRLEYNQILARNANLSCGVTQDKYMTITVEKKNIEKKQERISTAFTESFRNSFPSSVPGLRRSAKKKSSASSLTSTTEVRKMTSGITAN